MTGTRTETDRLINRMHSLATLPDWLEGAASPSRVEAALRRDVPELADGRVELLSCIPERLRAKGGDWVVRYRLRVTEAGGTAREIVLVGNLWEPSAVRPPGRQRRNDAPFGAAGWRCTLSAPRLDLEVEDADRGLPALAALVDRAQVTGLLEDVLRRAGHRATITSCEPNVVRYKPGSRCTIVYRLRYESADATLPNPVIVKAHRGDKGRAAWEAMRALWATPLRRGEAVTIAEPLGYLADSRVLIQGPVPEQRTLKVLVRAALAGGTPEALAELRTALSRTARGLAALHGSGAQYGRVATFDDELTEMHELVDRLVPSVPDAGPAVRPLLEQLAQAAGHLPREEPVSAHCTFRPAQVLLDGSRVGFIDFDSSCMAEPAADLGRFRAALRDVGMSTLTASRPVPAAASTTDPALLDELCEHFLDNYLRLAPVSRRRVLLWETCDLLKVFLHAWSKVRLARIEPRLAVLMHQLRANPLV
jgi:phosphotransferase family enzyme